MITMEAISNAVQDMVAGIVQDARSSDCDMQVVLVGPINDTFADGGLRHTLDIVVGASDPAAFFHHLLALDDNAVWAYAKHVRVIGHSDSVGRMDYNLELSKRRALNVKAWLVKQGGIANEDLLAIGLGPKKPMASNATEEGRAKNRRVEVVMATRAAATAAE
jgi:hypothetical protein